MLVGAGETIALAARHLRAHGLRRMIVANRSLDRAQELAQEFDGFAISIEALATHLPEADIVISSTASPTPVITYDAVRAALRVRRRKPIFMVDIAVPRDIEPEVAKLSDVYLYTVDDLSALVQTAGEKRQAAVEQAEAIIDAGVQSFAHWLDQRASVPLIQALNRQADVWREAELARARKQLARGADAAQVLDALARGLTHKLLHGAYAELHAADAEQRDQVADAVARLFLRRATRAPDREPDNNGDPSL